MLGIKAATLQFEIQYLMQDKLLLIHVSQGSKVCIISQVSHNASEPLGF